MLISNYRPIKTIEYIKQRYLNHPFYEYYLYGICVNNLIDTVIVLRYCKVEDIGTALRIIDLIGDSGKLVYCQLAFAKLLEETKAEYIDFVTHGINEDVMNSAGFVRLDNSLGATNTIVPHYFEPFLKSNVVLRYAYKTFAEGEQVVLCKGDGDQDRPNILMLKKFVAPTSGKSRFTEPKTITIVMYHYVRNFAKSAYPDIKGLDQSKFIDQLDYLSKQYQFISSEDVIMALSDETYSLPPNPVLLTFDDGYKDHYQTVFPELTKRNISGLFFPPSDVIFNRNLLDVNKVHHILASCTDKFELVDTLENLVMDELGFVDFTNFRQLYWQANRFDPAEVIYIKRMLQHALPEVTRNCVADKLFAKYVSADEKAFANELYLSLTELKEMKSAGMMIGSHGHKHYWLNQLTEEKQREDILFSIKLLNELNVAENQRTFCYPYGAYNETTINILREFNFMFAVTTEASVAKIISSQSWTLARLDTNDFSYK